MVFSMTSAEYFGRMKCSGNDKRSIIRSRRVGGGKGVFSGALLRIPFFEKLLKNFSIYHNRGGISFFTMITDYLYEGGELLAG